MRPSVAAVVSTLFFSVFSWVQASSAENWTEFRGSQGDGVGIAKNLPVQFGEEKNVRWKRAIHDRGWSSPVVWGNQIWLTTAREDGKELFVVCVDLDSGEIVHDIKVFDVSEPRFCHPTNSYASCTPAIEAGRLYVHFGSYGTACIDTKTAKTLWTRRDFVSDDFRGPASSPVIYKDLLFLTFDGVDFQFVAALDKTTGKTIWEKTREIDYETNNGDRKKAYCTPTVVEAGGRTQLISPAAMATISYDAFTGAQLWKVKHGGMNVATRPIVHSGIAYISSGPGGDGIFALPLDASGSLTVDDANWVYAKSIPSRGSHVISAGLVYLINDAGIATCLDAETGELVWQERLRGKFWSSPVVADGRIYCVNQEGDAFVLATGREFKILAENKLDDGCNASPAVVDNSLLIRTKTHLYRIQNSGS